MDLSSERIQDALTRLGERLFAAGENVRLVLAGGAALSLSGVIRRSTSDVDIIAWGLAPGSDELGRPPQPLPRSILRAVEAVGAELGLSPDWFDLRVASEWDLGLPPAFADRVEWSIYGRALHVGLAGRPDLIYLKLVAAADGQAARHLQDLLHLAPSDDELDEALRHARKKQVGLDADLSAVAERCRRARDA